MKQFYLLLFQALLVCSATFSQWVSNPSLNNFLTRTTFEDVLIKTVTDGNNGAIFIMADGLGNGNIYAQKINSVGQVQWNTILAPLSVVSTNDRKLSVTAIADGAGGAFIAWSDYRNNQFNGEIYVQRINSSGTALWTSGGVRVTSTNTQDDFYPVINVDGAGGLLVGWQMNNDNASQLQSFVQRYNSAGTALWTANGVQLSTAAGFRSISGLIKDGAGGLFAVFDDTRNDPNGLDYNYVMNNQLDNIDIYGQRVSSTGSLLWTANGLPLANAAGNQSELFAGLVEDGTGGFMFAFSDARNGAANLDVFAQRINSSGVAQWGTGTAVTTAGLSQYLFKTVSDAAGGLAIAFLDESNGACIVQKINNTGSPLWAVNGVPASPVGPFVYAVDLIPDAAGNIIVGFNVDDVSYIIAQKLDATGAQAWGPAGKIVCNRSSSFAGVLSMVGSDNGSVIAGWTDYRYTNQLEPQDIFCSKILGDGTVAGLPVYITIADGTWENPTSWTGNIVPNNGVPVIVRHTVTGATNIITGTLDVEAPAQLTMQPAARLLLLK